MTGSSKCECASYSCPVVQACHLCLQCFVAGSPSSSLPFEVRRLVYPTDVRYILEQHLVWRYKVDQR